MRFQFLLESEQLCHEIAATAAAEHFFDFSIDGGRRHLRFLIF